MRHARAAAILAASHAPPEQVATHLLAAPRRGESWVVDTLTAAAGSARTKGAADTAVVLLTRALEEPPAPERRPGLLLELGLAETLTSGAAAATHLHEAWETLARPARARLRRSDPRTHPLPHGAAHEAAAVASRAAAETPPELVDERQALRATELAAARYGTGGAPTAEELEAVRIEGAGPAPDSRVDAVVLPRDGRCRRRALRCARRGSTRRRGADRRRRPGSSLSRR